ncbi:tripartite tricarboxylate transporter family receptor [Bordetella hinzii CA90 BAL1384]|uniref:Bug family tripartite tricarboxylate transporter substrate binding protein n=1 Tax=Bordetella hinzii TaxID=103855 RepID=UPI00045A519D|nr:tripartite tricarboxylate transporter substrate binding protein [Bordetella hinzii]KCB27738.1 tripartite tricarboxylate transporter family receptor [Bordetella hinzii CA90 BAL1384]KCB45659.1 tripartite tricarboxylate transporter family receptor [Bordetella hinzii 5132]QDJ46434.1 tripartite tricarboxylate transporter substrate binding protein [Bordetella hinzii]QII86881.1 tripartite tricarboxylate transporter substrate binding protein [Bordetella hinzii]QWF37294.1 tripartite tricarboxylate t
MRIQNRLPGAWARLALLSCSLFAAAPVLAEGSYPERPVKVVVPFAPGGSSDTATRILGQLLGEKWGQTVIIENKPGASGSIGAMHVAKAANDGYTLLVAPVSIGTVDLVLKNPGFKRDQDLTPVTQFAKGDYVLAVARDLPVKTLPEFVEYVRARPNAVFHGAFGDASRLAFMGFAQANGIEPTNVNYRGESPALNALMTGEVQAVLATLVGARPFIEAGRIKALAIPSSARSPIVPDIPTAAETGIKGFDADFWFGLMAPAGLAEARRQKIASDVMEITARPEVRKRFQELGLIATASGADDFAKVVKYESERWVEVARRAGIEPQ